ncbi:unnamed protein product, partial [Prorocentrum cordatum]
GLRRLLPRGARAGRAGGRAGRARRRAATCSGAAGCPARPGPARRRPRAGRAAVAAAAGGRHPRGLLVARAAGGAGAAGDGGEVARALPPRRALAGGVRRLPAAEPGGGDALGSRARERQGVGGRLRGRCPRGHPGAAPAAAEAAGLRLLLRGAGRGGACPGPDGRRPFRAQAAPAAEGAHRLPFSDGVPRGGLLEPRAAAVQGDFPAGPDGHDHARSAPGARGRLGRGAGLPHGPLLRLAGALAHLARGRAAAAGGGGALPRSAVHRGSYACPVCGAGGLPVHPRLPVDVLLPHSARRAHLVLHAAYGEALAGGSAAADIRLQVFGDHRAAELPPHRSRIGRGGASAIHPAAPIPARPVSALCMPSRPGQEEARRARVCTDPLRSRADLAEICAGCRLAPPQAAGSAALQ